MSVGQDPSKGRSQECGAGNFTVSFQVGDVVACTMPTGHPEWTVNPVTGYSYNHHDEWYDAWWNDADGPKR